jgi:uncharacterized protein
MTLLEDLPLVDNHCHGVVSSLDDRAAFENLMNEGFDPPPPGTSHLESPIGLGVRRWCAPILDLEPLAPAGDYFERRQALGAEEANRRLLRAARIGSFCIDTGYRSSEVMDVAGMAETAGATAREVVRIEAVAEQVAGSEVAAERYADAFGAALDERSEGAVGLKTVVAYRGGFGLDSAPPSDAEVARAARGWLGAIESGRGPRLQDPVLLRHALWTAADVARRRGLPLQVHAGFGDPDLDIHLTNPSVFTPWVRALQPLGVNIVFLHCYPYHREAGYLAAVYPHVYFDLGASLNYAGPSADRLLAEAMEVAPFSKQLFSSDAFGLAELYVSGAALFREGLRGVLDGWVAGGRCSASDADEIAAAMGAGNARRIYPLDTG